MPSLSLIIIGIAALVGVVLLISLFSYLRRIVDPNQVHIVQSAKQTKSYGTRTENGNVYYKYPSWIPILGVTTVVLPISNFDLSLTNYDAYDRDKVPFKVDVTAFFRIENTNEAAQRVASIEELNHQLLSIVQGAVRTILATYTIDEIMLKREVFGKAFTDEVTPQLINWGILPVKNLELMDIRDANDSQVIQNIMAMKKSHIEMQSRIEVASNVQKAKEAEIAASQEVDLKNIIAKQSVDLKSIEAKKTVEVLKVEADQSVGEKTANKDRIVGIAAQKSRQEIAAEQAITSEKDMAVKRVISVRGSEIERDKAEVNLQQVEFNAQAVIREGEAEAKKRKAIFEADSALEIRLQMQKETAIGIAQALASGSVDLVPRVYIGGGSSESDSPTAMDTLTKITMMNMVKEHVK